MEHATLLGNTFEDYYTFDFHKELAEKIVKEDGITMENIGTNANLSTLYERGIELSAWIPLFEKNGDIPELKSVRFFEMIRYSLAISTFIKGIDQYTAGRDFSKTNHSQFAVFAYYSSIYQLLTSFLTLHGIIYIPKGIEEINIKTVERKIEKGQVREITKFHQDWSKFYKGHYSDSKGWKFIYINSNHKIRWKDFADLLKLYLYNNWEAEIPEGVKRFWGYIKVLNEYRLNRYKDEYSYSINFINKKEFNRCLNDHYWEPARIRHQKIYENRKYDIMCGKYFEKDGKPPDALAKGERDFFSDCCKDLILWQYTNLRGFIDFVKQNSSSEKVYLKGLNGIADNPFIKINRLVLTDIGDNKELLKINKSIPVFIELFLSP